MRHFVSNLSVCETVQMCGATTAHAQKMLVLLLDTGGLASQHDAIPDPEELGLLATALVLISLASAVILGCGVVLRASFCLSKLVSFLWSTLL